MRRKCSFRRTQTKQATTDITEPKQRRLGSHCSSMCLMWRLGLISISTEPSTTSEIRQNDEATHFPSLPSPSSLLLSSIDLNTPFCSLLLIVFSAFRSLLVPTFSSLVSLDSPFLLGLAVSYPIISSRLPQLSILFYLKELSYLFFPFTRQDEKIDGNAYWAESGRGKATALRARHPDHTACTYPIPLLPTLLPLSLIPWNTEYKSSWGKRESLCRRTQNLPKIWPRSSKVEKARAKAKRVSNFTR